MKSRNGLAALVIVTMCVTLPSFANDKPAKSLLIVQPHDTADSSISALGTPVEPPTYRNAWGLDILVSNDGFGLGTFFRREFTEDLAGFATLSVSESKDERENEQFSPYTYQSIIPGKLQRFMVIPLIFGVQQRLFREDIADNFRPFVNAGVGPTMIFSAPFADISYDVNGTPTATQIEFFKSLGRGKAHYTASAFIGFGANFGTEKTNLMGVNFRYYFTYLFGNGLPSLYDTNTGALAATKKDFGGFFITLNVGMAY